mgnify:CR=1 FL=1
MEENSGSSLSKPIDKAPKMKNPRTLNPTTQARCKETARRLREIGDELNLRYNRRHQNQLHNRIHEAQDALVFPLQTLALLVRRVIEFLENTP